MKSALMITGVELATAATAALALAQTPTQDDRSKDGSCEHGYVAAPPGSESLTSQLALSSIQMFMDDELKGTELTVTALDTSTTPGALNEMTKGLNDSMSAVRWNLPPGVVVVFYEDPTGKGEQLVLWGKGQHPDLDKWDCNDKMSRWAWFDVGAGDASSRSAGANLPPRGSEPAASAVPANTIQMFIDKDFRDDLKQVSPVTTQTHGQQLELPSGTADKLTSMRWNLPDGVIVTLYQTGDAEKQQIALWGQGQVKDLDIWDFNDKASRWSWAYVGAPSSTMPPPARPMDPNAPPPPAKPSDRP